MNPVDVALDPTGRHLIVTNHLSGWLTVHYLLGDGRFGPLTDYAQITGRLGPHKIDQLSPKPHQAVFHAGGKRLFVPNKGTDRVSVFDFDATAGSLMECPSLAAQLREGTGPRNGVAHPAMPILFVVGELDSTVYALRISREGRLDPFQVVSCLPDNFIGFSRASAVVLSPDGARLHVSNRGHDSICTFDVVGGGRLASPRWTGSDGRTPRFACYNPEGTGLLMIRYDRQYPKRRLRPGSAGRAHSESNLHRFSTCPPGKLSVPTRLKPIEEGAVSTRRPDRCRSSSASSCWRVPSLSRLMPTASNMASLTASVPPQFQTSSQDSSAC